MFDMIKSNPFLWLIIFLAVVAPSFLFGAVTVVLYIILGIIILFVLLSLFFGIKVKRMRSRLEDQMNSGAGSAGGAWTQSNTRQYRTQQEEGDVKIFSTPEVGEKRVNKDVGDYVEFEEIKK